MSIRSIMIHSVFVLTAVLVAGRLFNGYWHPNAGQFVYTGWVAVVSYVILTVLSGHIMRLFGQRDADNPHIPRDTGLWFLLTAIMFFLCLNTQLNLQVAFASMGRELARDSGWYFARRTHQAEFVMAIILLGLVIAGIGIRLYWQLLRQHGVALLSAIGLLTFVAVRSMSYHYVDRILGMPIGAHNVNWVLEFAGILAFAVGLIITIRYGIGSDSSQHNRETSSSLPPPAR